MTNTTEAQAIETIEQIVSVDLAGAPTSTLRLVHAELVKIEGRTEDRLWFAAADAAIAAKAKVAAVLVRRPTHEGRA